MSMVFLSSFYDISMNLLSDFRRISMGIKRISMGFPWYFYGIPIGLFLDFHEVSMGSPWHFYGIPVGFLWVSCRVSILCRFYGISMGFLWDFHDICL